MSTNLTLQSDLNNLFTLSHTSELYFDDSKFAHIYFWSDQLTAGGVTYRIEQNFGGEKTLANLANRHNSPSFFRQHSR